jgi:exodeoxyribonuclease VII large subunit
MVADARASTPTKAGVIAVPDMRDVLAQLEGAQSRLRADVQSRLKYAEQSLDTILASSFFRNPYWLVNNAMQTVDEAQTRLTESTKTMFSRLHYRLSGAMEMVMRIEPGRLLAEKRIRLNSLCNGAEAKISSIVAKRKLQLTAVENKLAAMNPKSVLGRGYSITSSKSTGKIVAGLGDVEIEDILITELADRNFIESRVTNKQNSKEED